MERWSAEEVLDITRNPFKKDFPLLAAKPDLAFLDSAATTQRPASVIEAQSRFYETMNANPLRGLYELSVEATAAVTDARETVRRFINAPSADEIVFCRNTTEGLNLVAKTVTEWALRAAAPDNGGFGPAILKPGDDVVITIMEHHSNLIPWQQATEAVGANLVYLYPDEEGHFSEEELAKITPNAAIVSVTHVSNVLGCETPVKEIGRRAHDAGALFVVDAAQSVPHIPVDVQDIGCDLLAFSGHKVLGPFGVGVLWGKAEILNDLPPFLTGGEMIDTVTQTSARWSPIPTKFEAGTQDAAGIYATSAALDYFTSIPSELLEGRERALMELTLRRLEELPYVRLFGPRSANERYGAVSFNVGAIHPHDVASLLDSRGVAIRAGHHCAQPLLTWLGCESTSRASVAFYNDESDIDRLVEAIEYVWRLFGGDN